MYSSNSTCLQKALYFSFSRVSDLNLTKLACYLKNLTRWIKSTFIILKRRVTDLPITGTMFYKDFYCNSSSIELPEKYSITHVIFDFDGVLVDSEQAYYEANDRFLRVYGKSYNNELKLGMMGRTKEDGAKWLLETTGLNAFVNLADYMEQFESYSDELFPKTDILPGIRRLIEHFDQHGIPMAICTSSDVEEFNKKVPNCSDLLPKMSHIVLVGSDKEIKRGKPAPDPYIAAMNRFEEIPISPKNVLVFEDSVSGVRSALAAGMTTVMVPQPEYLPKTWVEIEAIFEQQVAEIIYSMEHFFPEKYGLPSLMGN